ncbi:MAG: uracil-DNA glycosylase family protein [Pseudomonadota bacterium]
MSQLSEKIEACDICAERFSKTKTAHSPRPVFWGSDTAPILIAGQAPGARVHQSGKPFDDPSGDRLRSWLGVEKTVFYDRTHFAIVPMAFCFPGYSANGSDLPPPIVCSKTWHAKVIAAMPQVKLRILIGGYAFKFYLGRSGVTDTVRAWRDVTPGMIPLPHPSWRNTAWLKKNPWFENDVLPFLRARVTEVLT